MSRARDKGTRWESAVARWLTERLGREVSREPLHGSRDVGDLRGLTICGHELAVECKDRRELRQQDWLRQAEAEAQNRGALAGIVVYHLPGVGIERTGRQVVLMRLDDLAAIIDAAEGRA